VMGGGGVAVGGVPVGVNLYGPAPGREGARLITVTEGGDAIVHAAGCGSGCDAGAGFGGFGGDDRIVEEWSESVRWKATGHAAACRASAGGAILALGGKGIGNDLKLYDVETQAITFKAKPPPENWLKYRAPPWVSAIQFMPGSDSKSVLLGTGEHVLRMYDIRTNKRAVLDMSVGEAVITSLAVSHDANIAFVANAQGQLNSIDLRKVGQCRFTPG